MFWWLTAGAIEGLGRDVSRGDDAREKAGEIEFDHGGMDARTTVEIQPPSVGVKKFEGGLGVLWPVFLPRNQNAVAHGDTHLDGADDRTRREARDHLSRLTRVLSQFKQARNTPFLDDEAVAEIQVQTAFQKEGSVTVTSVSVGA